MHFMTMKDFMLGVTLCALILLSVVVAFPTCVFAVDPSTPDSDRIYTTREERREAGSKHLIIEGLTLSVLGEIEYATERFDVVNRSSSNRTEDFSRALQLGLEAEIESWLKAEIIYEYDADQTSEKYDVDEAIVVFEAEALDLEIGRLNLPFGVYFSHFASGPLLEFGETRGDGAVLTYEPKDGITLSAFLYDGLAASKGGHNWDAGVSFEASPGPFMRFGMSCLSDLADSQSHFLSDHANEHENRVGGASGFIVFGSDWLEFTAEYLTSLDSFEALDADRNRPQGWNLELSFFALQNFEWALRFEGSDELEDAPHRQGGVAATWIAAKDINVTVEYLMGRFERGLSKDSAEREQKTVQRIGALLSVSF